MIAPIYYIFLIITLSGRSLVAAKDGQVNGLEEYFDGKKGDGRTDRISHKYILL
jgi:hypothetical protein